MDGLHIIGLMHVIMIHLRGSDGLWDGAEMKADFCTNSTRGKECLMLYHIPSKIAWDQAAKFCTSVNSVLASILDSQIQENMRAVFQSASTVPSSEPHAWIGGREENNDAWIWLDGSSPKYTASLPTYDYRTCVHLSMNGDAPTLQPLECRLTKRAFLCKQKHAGCIRANGFSSVEIYISNTSYCSYNQGPAISWYEANNMCQQYDGMLASLPFLTESRAERTALMANLTSLQNEDIWIGLRRRRWKWEYIHELIIDAPALFMYTNWRSGDPNGADQRCSYVDRWDKWADESCTKKTLPYTICQNITNIAKNAKTTVSNEVSLRNHTLSGTTETPQGSREAIPTDSTTSLQPQTTNHGLTIIIAVVVSVVIILLIIITALLLIRRRRSRRDTPSIASSSPITDGDKKLSNNYANVDPNSAHGYSPTSMYTGDLPAGPKGKVIEGSHPEAEQMATSAIRDITPPDKSTGSYSLQKSPPSQSASISSTKPPVASKPTTRHEREVSGGESAAHGPLVDPYHKVAPDTGDVYAQVVKSYDNDFELELHENELYGS